MGAAGSVKKRKLGTPVTGYVSGEEKLSILSFKNPGLRFLIFYEILQRIVCDKTYRHS
jgi:hypothetical protein